MRKVVILAFVAIGVLGVGAAATAQDDDGSSQNGARLNGYQEVTSISTTGFGSFHIKFNKDDTADYVLSYRGIETPVTQAHIHFAQRVQNGPIQVCSPTATSSSAWCRRSAGPSGCLRRASPFSSAWSATASSASPASCFR